MKRILAVILLSVIIMNVYSQRVNIYQSGISGQQNLNAISNLAPYSSGGMGIDTRYSGVVGTPRLFDTLLTSYLLLNDKDFYIKMETDIDLFSNAILYTDPRTRKLFALPSGIVKELIIIRDTAELVFMTTQGFNFNKPFRENKFCQVLAEGPVMFIKIPVKKFTEADYKGAYSVDRRYDEYEYIVKYYITGNNGALNQIQLNRKSLIKAFPGKKALINETIRDNDPENNESMVITLLKELL